MFVDFKQRTTEAGAVDKSILRRTSSYVRRVCSSPTSQLNSAPTTGSSYRSAR
jgi:hypothetical protein